MSRPGLASRRAAFVAAGALAVTAGRAAAQSKSGTGDSAQVIAVMEAYAAALRAGNVETLAGLYSADGVFMRENLPAVVGRVALRTAYRQIFATLKVDLRFDIQEVEATGDLAWARGVSKGRIRTLATGVEAEEAFNLLMVLRRDAGAWKIRCFLYASAKPGTTTPQ